MVRPILHVHRELCAVSSWTWWIAIFEAKIVGFRERVSTDVGL